MAKDLSLFQNSQFQNQQLKKQLFDSGTTHVDSALEIHNLDHQLHTYYELHTPLHIILMYNTSGIPDVTNSFFTVSPEGASHLINHSPEVFISPPHRHNYFEFLIVLKGKLMQEIEGKEYLYPAGSCCLINRNITHTERFLGEGTVLFLGLSLPYVEKLSSDYTHTMFPSKALPMGQGNRILTFMQENMTSDFQKYYLDFFPVYQKRKITDTLKRISDALLHAMLLPYPGVDFAIQGNIYELFSFLNDTGNYHLIPVKLSSTNDSLIFSRIRHLMADTNGRISRSELEGILHYSGNYLNTIVKNHTGKCLFDYGTDFCMEKAGELLTTTDLPVSAIIEQLHFTNQGHFYQLFRKKYGMLPKEYRKQR